MAESVLRAESFLSREKPFHVAYQRGYFAREHTHARYAEFFYLLQGRAVHCVNGVEHAVAAGSLVLLREQDVHSMRLPRSSEVRYVNVAFSTHILEQAARYLDAAPWLLKLREPGRPLAVQLRAQVRSDFARRLHAACAVFPGQDSLLRALLLEVLQQVLYLPVRDENSQGGEAAVRIPEWLEQVCALLRRPEAFLRPVTELPRLAHKSAAHLARSFRKYLNTTPTDYLNAQRLDHAARLLASSDKKILAIAFECGFEQPGYFYRLFRRRFGRTPLRYRQLGRQVVDPAWEQQLRSPSAGRKIRRECGLSPQD